MTSDREYYLFALKIIGDFGMSIAAPVVAFVLLGQYLDGRYGYGPYFTIAGFVLAAALSARIVWRKAKSYGKEYQRMNERK